MDYHDNNFSCSSSFYYNIFSDHSRGLWISRSGAMLRLHMESCWYAAAPGSPLKILNPTIKAVKPVLVSL
jgi:hypothetical protein